MMSSIDTKLKELQEILEHHLPEGLIVAFSGGIDSAFLLWAAAQANRGNGEQLLALTTLSPSVPQNDIDDATDFVRRIGVPHELVDSYEFEKEGYVRNTGLRCYHCKSTLFEIARQIAADRGFQYIAYGYNATDTGDIRPGHQAAIENNVLYPLATVGFTKQEIREIMAEQGFAVAEKPASPCLSSRIMTGVRVTPEKLQDIEYLETMLREGGLKVFRVRLHEHDDIRWLRLEIDPDEMRLALELREAFVTEAKERGYQWATLDLGGYRTGGAVL